MKQPTVSVIIPTFNRANDVEGAIKTVSSQSYPVAEIIIVDDGSTDETWDIIKGMTGPVRPFRQENRGVSAARNLGLLEAQGDLIAFLDVDDRWDQSKIARQVDVLRSLSTVQWCATDVVAVDGSGAVRPGSCGVEGLIPLFREMDVDLDAWLSRWLKCTEVGSRRVYHGDALALLLHGNMIYPSTVLMTRSIADRVGAFDVDLRRAEDNDYFLRMAEAGPMVMIPEGLVAYRIGEADALTERKHTEELIVNALESLGRAKNRSRTLTDVEIRALATGQAMLLRRLAYELLSNHRAAEARKSIAKLWKGGGNRDLRSVSIYLATFIPSFALNGAVRIRRTIRALLQREGAS